MQATCRPCARHVPSIWTRAFAQILENFTRGIAPRQTSDTAAGVAAGTAQVQVFERPAIRTLAQQWTCAEHLIQPQRAMKNIAANQTDAAFQIQRAQGFIAQHAA